MQRGALGAAIRRRESNLSARARRSERHRLRQVKQARAGAGAGVLDDPDVRRRLEANAYRRILLADAADRAKPAAAA